MVMQPTVDWYVGGLNPARPTVDHVRNCQPGIEPQTCASAVSCITIRLVLVPAVTVLPTA